LIDQLFTELSVPFFWLSLGKIIWIDMLLSGDNALVIAMACRALPKRQRVAGIILGAGAAVAMRIAFTGVIAELMAMPYLKLIGGLLLMFVAIKLLAQDDDDGAERDPAGSLFAAIRMVVIADIVMSLDNMIAVAAAANGSIMLLAIGLMISIPLVVTGATLIVALLNRFPFLIGAGAGLLGWISGEVIVSDQFVIDHFPLHAPSHEDQLFVAIVCTALVLCIGYAWKEHRRSHHEVA